MKINDKHFELFKKEFIKWTKIFGIDLDYTVKFHFGLQTTKFKNAYIVKSFDNGVADVYFDKEFDYKLVCDDDLITSIKLCAKHEAIHLLIERLVVYSKWRWITEEQFLQAEEELVRKLTKIICNVKNV